MSEMSCKTCGRWAAGWCLAQQLGTSRDEVCNAWELSRVVEWEDENEKLKSRIAELELIVDKLVEGIDSLTSEFPLEIEYIEAVEIAKGWKEG